VQYDGTPSREKIKEFIQKVNSEGSVVFEWKHQRSDGSLWDAEVHLIRFQSDRRRLLQVALIDITRRKQAEEEQQKLQNQLLQSQKMESVGRLAGGVAHDFNNMLSVIIGRTELAMMKLLPSEPAYTDLLTIKAVGERSANLTRQLLAFARRQTIAPKILSLNDLIESMLKMLRQLIGEDITLLWKPAPDLWKVKLDPAQLDQVLANLVVNARDAIRDIGKVTIETANVLLDKDDCSTPAGCSPGQYVRLTVSDTGCGMDQETLANVFEPFFTTKPLGLGTGLGLATVYGIVKQNNGFIDVRSEPGRGTVFQIYQPRHTGGEMQDSGGISAAALGGGETILLVEDEPEILEVTRIMLTELGYRLLTAATPGQAVRLAGEHTGAIHLLMTDVIMPEMNGRDLAQRLGLFHPDMKRLFMSGYTADVIAHHGVLEAGVHFIQKPFMMAALAAKVRAALDQDPT
ncbi:MAG: ATP-binding protein, partial [Thermodesulfobacteriota bacterium]